MQKFRIRTISVKFHEINHEGDSRMAVTFMVNVNLFIHDPASQDHFFASVNDIDTTLQLSFFHLTAIQVINLFGLPLQLVICRRIDFPDACFRKKLDDSKKCIIFAVDFLLIWIDA